MTIAQEPGASAVETGALKSSCAHTLLVLLIMVLCIGTAAYVPLIIAT